jgi:hypothetical protein
MSPKGRMILPSAPRLAVTWIIGEVRRSLVRFTTAGVLRLVSPAQLPPWLRFDDPIQKRKAAPQHGANRINSDIGDVAQAEVTDITTRVVLSLCIRVVLVVRGALRYQA